MPTLAHSQSAKCYQTVAVNCTDSIADYLTISEKKNLFRLHITLERLQEEVNVYRMVSREDSLYIANLKNNIEALLIAVNNYETATTAQQNAIAGLQKIANSLRRQMKLQKVKSILGGTFGGVAAFGAGVGTAFIILKTL